MGELSIAEQVEELQKALSGTENYDSSLKSKIQSLIEELDDYVRVTTGGTMNIEDHMDLAKKYLSEKAVQALAKKGKNIIEQYNKPLSQEQVTEVYGQGVVASKDEHYVREMAVCQYFTCQVRKDRIEEGVKAIAEVINELAEVGAIHSCLAPISSVDLAAMMYQHPTCAIICYVHIKSEFYDWAKTRKLNTPEGGIGPAMHALEIELPPGEFFAECRISHQLSMLVNLGGTKTALEARIFECVQEYLKVLPEGTRFLGYREVAISDLSIPIELKFSNPLLADYKRVELDHTRAIAIVDEKIKEFNLLTGVRYFNRNGRIAPYS